MTRKLTRAGEILIQEGVTSLGKKGGAHLLGKTNTGSQLLYRLSQKEIVDRMQKEEDLDDVLDTVLEVKPGLPPYQVKAMQIREELKELAKYVTNHNPTTILEIGTASGGTLYTWSRYLHSVNEIISLDLPGGEFGGGYSKQKARLFRTFAPETEMYFVQENSHSSGTLKKIRKDVLQDTIGREKVDFLFIDGDHTYDGVKQDFDMYSSLVAEGGIIALHDIVHHPDRREIVVKRQRDATGIEDRHLNWSENFSACNVDRFWNEVSDKYDTKEFISHPQQTWGGIGVVEL